MSQKNMSSNCIMDIVNCNIEKVFLPLKANTKVPFIAHWQELIKTPYDKFNNGSNYGVLCGKVNNIMVVDVDIKNYKQEAEKFINDFKLHEKSKYVVKTQSGGFHFYFKYDDEIKTMRPKIDNKSFVDIQVNKTFVVAEGSSIDGKKYECIKGNIGEIGKLNKSLRDELIKYAMKNKEQKTKQKEKIENIIDYSTHQLSEEEKKEFKKMVFHEEVVKLNYHFNNMWFNFTIAFKKYGLFKMWDEWSKHNNPPTYDLENNKKIWKSININKMKLDKYYIQKVYNNITNENKRFYNEIEYVKLTQEIENKIEINNKYLTDENKKPLMIIKDQMDKNKVTIIKSSMGTGKTTMINSYIKDNSDYDLISIVSRRSLAYAQDLLFNKDSKDKYYNYLTASNKEIEKANNIIVQIDSINKIMGLRQSVKRYILYLDEITSMLRYLATSTTLKTKRRDVASEFIDVVRNADKIICTDADINDSVFTFFEMMKMDFSFIDNVFKAQTETKHYKVLYDNSLQVIKKLKNEKVIFASDSKTECDTIYKYLVDSKIDEKKILKITGFETKQNDRKFYDTEQWEQYDFIIYSPSIVYGVDFVPKEKYNVVFSVNCCSVNPLEIGQMIFRCRNIKNIYSIYERKFNFFMPDIKDLSEYMKELESIYSAEIPLKNEVKIKLCDEDNTDEEDIMNFLYLYYTTQDKITKCDYEKYITQSIATKGIMTINYQDKDEEKITKEAKKEIKKEAKLDSINKCIEELEQLKILMDTYTMDDINKKTENYKPYVERIKYLKIGDDKDNIDKYSDYIIDNYKLSEHITASFIIDLEEGGKMIENAFNKAVGEQDFIKCVMGSSLGKLEILRKIKNGDLSQAEQLSKMTRIKFNEKKKDAFYYVVCNSLVDKLFDSKQRMIKGQKLTEYTMNETLRTHHKELLSFRNKKYKKHEISLEEAFGDMED